MPKKLTPNVIYYWNEGDRITGAMQIKVKGVNDLYGYSFLIEDNPFLIEQMKKDGKNVDKDFTLVNTKKATQQVKIQLSNVYNALMVHGKKVLDKNGDIDPELFKEAEVKLSKKKTKNGVILPKEFESPFIALKDFKTIQLTSKEAVQYNLL